MNINLFINKGYKPFVCGHKDTIIFVITKIVIYLCRKYLDYYCVRTHKLYK